jgi:transposase
MATLQKRKSRGHTYWSIVESRRINGKPRPVILEYLGTAETLLKRLIEGIPKKVRSYTHGDVAVMLDIAEEFKIVETINKHLKSKPFRDGFTVGGSLLLAAIGRICRPTSKRNWYEGWARHTSLSYLIRMSLNRLDSQHFWDQMEALPTSTIPLIEEEIVANLLKKEEIALDTLLCDTTNFFTYIDSANHRCTIAQRGKNKQKRMDLRQFGLLLLVSRKDQIPILHKVYQGNLADQTVFKEEFKNILNRFKAICGSLEDITLVFDQGNNSKKILKNVTDGIHFVGALSPYHHKALIKEANDSMTTVSINGRDVLCYNARKEIWGIDFTVAVYISEKLLQGQIRGIEQNIKKLFKKLSELKEKIVIPTKRGKKRTQAGLEKKISSMIGSLSSKDIIRWEINHLEKDAFDLSFWVDEEQFNFLKKQWLGRRIVITNRHQWTTEEIISAYWGQSNVENAFKKMKNPFHLAIRPQYHWTDQKIEVHGFICFLAFLMVMIAYKRAKEKVGFKGSTHTLLEKLSAIRLATFIESPAKKTKGRYKTNYRLEEMDPDIFELAEAMNVTDLKLKSNIPFSVYN